MRWGKLNNGAISGHEHRDVGVPEWARKKVSILMENPFR